MMVRNKVLSVLFCIFVDWKLISGQCITSSVIGSKDVDKKTKSSYFGTGINAVLLPDDQMYEFGCCGFISTWKVYARSGIPILPTSVKGQVWYYTGTGNVWNLRGENTIPISTADAINPYTVPVGSRIIAEKLDKIGFYEDQGVSVITYDTGNNNNIFSTTTFTSPETSYNWTATNNKREHAIQATIDPSIAPRVTNLPDTTTIANTLVGGSVVFNLMFNDFDSEDVPTLKVAIDGTTGNAATLFDLDSVTDQVKVKAGVQLIPGTHTMTFRVTDQCGLSNTGFLTIVIENKPPILASLSVSDNTTISEMLTASTLLHTLLVTEADPYTCTLETTSVPFEIKVIPGSTYYGIYLKDGAAMDYDTQNAYVLSLSCSDPSDKTPGTFTVYLIRNEPPVINSLPLAIDVTEDTFVETTLYTFSVTDPTNDVVRCSVVSTVPASTTIIFLKQNRKFNEFDIILQSNPKLNYDTRRTYRLNIDCTDGKRSDSSIFFMNVKRNQPPVFTNLQNTTTLSSVSSFIGQIVFDVNHKDSENDQVTYTMSCVPSTNCPFKIYDSGEILLQRQITGEVVPAYDLYVYVSDGKSKTGPRSLTVHILDINYVPVIRNLPLPSPLVVPENSNPSLSIFQVSIQDNDGGDIHTYKMTSDPGEGMTYFKIDASTGLVSTSSTNINYEALSSTTYTFSITVSDSKDSSSKNLTINISNINEAPLFTKKSYVLSVDEGPAGSALTSPGYLYTDQDTGNKHKFSMICGPNVGYFSISPTTGDISLAAVLDVDAPGLPTSYPCTITVSDGALTDSASLVINVNNINDNAPTFSTNFFTFYVNLYTAVKTVLGTVVATDADTGAFGTFVYSLDQTAIGGGNTFGIKTNGDLYVKTALSNSYTYGQSLTFTALATDTGGRQGIATIYVLIPQTTTTTTTTTDRYVTFWEYPANPPWVIVAIIFGVIICILPCYVIWKNGGQCSYKGRLKPLSEDTHSRINNIDGETSDVRGGRGRNYNPEWMPWKRIERTYR